MAFKMKAGSEGPFKKNYPSAFKTHEGPDKPHKPTKFDKFAKKVGEYSAKIGLGPIYGGTKWMMGKTDKPNIVKAIDFVKSKFNKNKDE